MAKPQAARPEASSKAKQQQKPESFVNQHPAMMVAIILFILVAIMGIFIQYFVD